ncbi:ATP-dependent acyl-CoA ligase [Rhodococcus sp. KBS0724]|uniref:class I adenylate-forming enzyme family protein n=1 Tax=Rhodococcus sp. KBS0724 TaxID=1179674 RepID=UPI00110E49C8|nr:AMP-binding protein [Rhodococcus sp. KBS0724]TSD47060.1 ATP-dependent acyl-CoA ligase [Rhodococcus sp. KBS0724]
MTIQALGSLVERQCESNAHRRFLVEVGGRGVTYGELRSSARAWAAALSEPGIQVGDNVALMMPTSIDWVASWAGVGAVGARCVAVHASLLGSSLRYVVEQSKSVVCVVHVDYLDEMVKMCSDLPSVRAFIVVGGGGKNGVRSALPSVYYADSLVQEGKSVHRLDDEEASNGEFGIVYTSGTTGKSKGVRMSWALLARLFGGTPFDALTDEDTWYLPLPMSHLAGMAAVHSAAAAGSMVVLRDGWRTQDFWDDVSEYGCTASILGGSMASFLLKSPPTTLENSTSLRYLSVTPIPADVAQFQSRFGVQIFTLWGLSETGSVTYSELGPQCPGTCGRLRPGDQLRLVDADGNDVADGEVGEAWVKAPHDGLTAGYFDMPAETAAVFVDGWFHSGDLLRRDEGGNYYFVGRLKDSIRRSGENVSAAELEQEVNAHNKVRDSAAVGVPSGYGDEDIKVFVEVLPGEDFDADELREFLRSRVPKFMIPRYIQVIDVLPRTDTGRVKKDQLRALSAT